MTELSCIWSSWLSSSEPLWSHICLEINQFHLTSLSPSLWELLWAFLREQMIQLFLTSLASYLLWSSSHASQVWFNLFLSPPVFLVSCHVPSVDCCFRCHLHVSVGQILLSPTASRSWGSSLCKEVQTLLFTATFTSSSGIQSWSQFSWEIQMCPGLVWTGLGSPPR